MTRPVALNFALFLGLCSVTMSLAAAPPKGPVAAPDPALVEFLADWQGTDGRWVDPMTFIRIDPARLQTDAVRPSDKLPVPVSGTGTADPNVKRAAR